MISVKVLLISTTIVSAAILLKLSIPILNDFAVYDAPLIYNAVVSWLKPPYLYLIINCIIIAIVLSSKFQPKKDDVAPRPAPVEITPVDFPATEYKYEENIVAVEDQKAYDVKEEKTLESNQTTPFDTFVVDSTSNKENEFIVGKSIQKKDFTGNSPSVSARFGRRRNGSPEAGGFSGSAKTVLGVSKMKKQKDTIESTWKTITDGGRAITSTRNLKKSETWVRESHEQEITPQKKKITKSVTFSEKTISSPGSSSSGGSTKFRSLSNDEVNRRVEAFIKKFNDDMRMQNQESKRQYEKIVKR